MDWVAKAASSKSPTAQTRSVIPNAIGFCLQGFMHAAASPLRVVMNGTRLDIQASVDLEGLKKLQAILQKYQGILEMMEPEKNEAAN